jgi:hypothetical protein
MLAADHTDELGLDSLTGAFLTAAVRNREPSHLLPSAAFDPLELGLLARVEANPRLAWTDSSKVRTPFDSQRHAGRRSHR